MVSYKTSKSSSEESVRMVRKLRGVKARETRSSSNSCNRGRPPKSKDRRDARSTTRMPARTASSDPSTSTSPVPMASETVEVKEEDAQPVKTDDEASPPAENNQMPQYIFYIPRVPQHMMGMPHNHPVAPMANQDRVPLPGQAPENYFYAPTQLLAPNQMVQTCHGSLQPSALAIPTRRCHNNIEEKLQDIVSAYIDYLLDENEDRTEISKSYAPPLDPNFEAEEYYQRIQRKRVMFPTKKFCKWLEENGQYNYQEVMDLISVVRGELPMMRFKEEYKQYAHEVEEQVENLSEKPEPLAPTTDAI